MSTCIISAPYCPSLLESALRDGLPGIVWFRCGAQRSADTRYTCFTFSDASSLCLPDGSGLKWLDQHLKSLPPGDAAWCGYFALIPYEAGALCDSAIRTRPKCKESLLELRRLDAVYVADALKQTAEFQFSSQAGRDRRADFVRQVTRLCETATSLSVKTGTVDKFELEEAGELSPEEYSDTVRRIQERIHCGDFYECNFTQRFRLRSAATPRDVAIRLLRGPARHAAYVDIGSRVVISNSPEQFLRVDGTHIATCPIKGSSQRFADGFRDRVSREQLSSSEKDRAEHTMVVDMARNDLGRICRIGSVRLTVPYAIESHPGLHHLVSTVEGDLEFPDMPVSKILSATFPAASITGAPKIAVIEAIEGVEKSPRGLYTGALGFLGSDGLDLNVAIRTIVATPSDAGSYHYEFGAGGAVVADSDPAAEYNECLVKARPLYNAIRSAERLNPAGGG